MIDFKELPQDGTKFEQMVKELFLSKGLDVHWTGVGPDEGKDLIITEKSKGLIDSFTRKWLISCKHKAHGGKSASIRDIDGIVDDTYAAEADGFLLITSTQPSASVVKRMDVLNTNGSKKIYKYWDSVELEKQLKDPSSYDVLNRFLPKSAEEIGWNIYKLISNNKVWVANFKGHYIYLATRIEFEHPKLDQVEKIIEKLESLSTGNDKLRLRAVYYDNKHENYNIFVDHLYDKENNEETIKKIYDGLHDMHHMEYYPELGGYAYQIYWDIRHIKENFYDDRYHNDSEKYYKPFLHDFEHGGERDIDYKERYKPND